MEKYEMLKLIDMRGAMFLLNRVSSRMIVMHFYN